MHFAWVNDVLRAGMRTLVLEKGRLVIFSPDDTLVRLTLTDPVPDGVAFTVFASIS